ncbi:xeroderma pigmentosum group C-complementing protein [Sporothrix schenckii 1099-18]|uniref:Rad4 beta-hairpin domain-containing protein n=2 Tax=Sporothrix schenckii TaxID=29908 RepID=U7Q5S2_SPOS1|nr:xeroderma pigmentosum group C-complementing protein [Sporothrix schenckii 1099-18]ERT02517.1 hypothetical protein HMPREF1624_00816 [Sporothrix schenckii ATCC 58251]KJR80199.1 xeroderma pigmentosum group C-complementing protein [Sporothrix schenckii 1099-18]
MSSSRAPRKRPGGGDHPSPVPPKKTKAAVVKKEKPEEDSLALKANRSTRRKTATPTAAAKRPSPSPSASKAVPRKATLFDDLDGVGSSPASANGVSDLQYLKSLENDGEASEDSDSSSELSAMSDADFEDVPLAPEESKKEDVKSDDDDDNDDEDEDMEFEDVTAPEPAPFSFLSMAVDHDETGNDGGAASGDLELTLIEDTRVSVTGLGDAKKGPTKIERLVRSATHCVHVQSLLWHNAKRNAWLCDPEVQGLLLSHIPPRLWDEVDRWRLKSGLVVPDSDSKTKGKGNTVGKGKGNSGKGARAASREWSGAAARLEPGAVDMSHGDPLFRLLRALSYWWRQKFRITAPGLRKKGYLTLERLDDFLKAAKDTAGNNSLRFGERIRNRAAFRNHAASLEGSRDVGAQLFTALLRALGLEARLVANLQPLGFGWTKLEEADADEEGDKVDGNSEAPVATTSSASTPATPTPKKPRPKALPRRPKTKVNPKEDGPIVIDDDSDLEMAEVNSDNESVVFVPDAKTTPTKPAAPKPAFDKDLHFPIYWTEVLSPVTQKYIPVDALVKHIVATSRELIESLEPRGGKADKARQVMGYVVGYSADGTAKDVTVRYLRRQMLPGRTRGVRFPVEKIPVYNKHGKIRRYDMLDWFRQSVMRGYVRGQSAKYPLTEVDDAEDSTDLRPAAAEKKEVKEGEETLQYYKQSKTFVLERHLKREEALVADAVPVKVFRNGKKGKGAAKKKKSKNDDADLDGDDDDDDDTADAGGAENVYLRKDVVQVKSAETWHKQGRAPVDGQRPLKRVPYRAATINRRREIAEAEAASGEKVLQGLYSYEQTDWIIPPPIQNGVIPKNAYGNIDLFAEHMLPKGAVHVPFRGAMRVCKKLQIDFAEAVIDFEFGHRMAVPVIQGVVIAEEHHDRVMEELVKDEAERTRKADEKKRAVALSLWRKLLMGLRIVERIRKDYGEVREDDRVFGHRDDRGVVDLDSVAAPHDDVETAGGFLPEGYEYEDEPATRPATTSSFFPVHDEGNEDEGDFDGGGFVLE